MVQYNNLSWEISTDVNTSFTPTKTSQLENDVGFVTKEEIPTVSTYIHNQISPSNEWIITHNLARYPGVTVVDSGGNVVIGDVLYVSDNQLKVRFSVGFSGKAYIN